MLDMFMDMFMDMVMVRLMQVTLLLAEMETVFKNNAPKCLKTNIF